MTSLCKSALINSSRWVTCGCYYNMLLTSKRGFKTTAKSIRFAQKSGLIFRVGGNLYCTFGKNLHGQVSLTYLVMEEMTFR